MNQTWKALIIGGGIAGPALALFLRRHGLQATVFEAYPRAENVGGGFQIAPNGMDVLETLGLAEAVTTRGAPMRGFVFRNHRGKVIGRMRMNRVRPAVTISRAPFYELLLSEAARQGVEIQYGKRLRDFSEESATLVARFEDGTEARGDLLVGADGVHSTVRALLFPEAAKARYSGFLGIGAFVTAGTVEPPDPADAQQMSFVLGPRLQFGYASMSHAERRWGWWCHLPQEHEPSRTELQATPDGVFLARLREAFGGWHDPVERFLTSSERILRTAIYDVPPLPAWSRGRVVLVGDAAHAMSPAGGQGASLALEDASALSQLLGRRGSSLTEAFREFERVRRKRAEPIVAQARENDQRSLKSLGSFGMWMRDAMFPVLAPLLGRALEKQYAAR